jgi:RecX family
MKTPDDSSNVDGLRVYAYVSRLHENGSAPGEIQQKLIEKGIDAQRASALVDRLIASEAKKKIRARAARLLSEGTPTEELLAKLIEAGFDGEMVAPVIEGFLEERKRNEQERKDDPKALWRIMGVGLLVVGFCLAVGNRSGLFPTFSYAGTIFMGIGFLVFMMGNSRFES